LPLLVSALNSFGDSGFKLGECQTLLFGVLMGFGEKIVEPTWSNRLNSFARIYSRAISKNKDPLVRS
jgi:hypothetical protein